jgi:hypothetical protein
MTIAHIYIRARVKVGLELGDMTASPADSEDPFFFGSPYLNCKSAICPEEPEWIAYGTRHTAPL